MKYLKTILSLFVISLSLTLTGQTSMYVSPEGNDANSGSLNKPFKTIQRAQAEVKKYSDQMENDVHVFLRGGIYRLEEPLVFTAKDGGSKDHHVIYSAYKDEKPQISGGEKIENWKVTSVGLWVAKYNGPYFRQLYVNGERRVRAREPDIGEYFRVIDYDFKHKEILAHRGDLSNISSEDLSNLEMILQMHWAESILRVQSIAVYGPYNVKNANVVIHPDDAQIIFNRPHPGHRAGQSYHLENALSFVDQPGEWFLDHEAGLVYYKPFEHETLENTTFMVPTLENLIVIKGEKGKPVKNLAFEGISFMHSNWNRPGNDTYANIQAGFFILTSDSANNNTVLRPPSAIHVTWAQHLEFRDNVFRNLGSTGLDLNYGTLECIIEGNVFEDIAGGGVMVGKFVKDSTTYINGPYNPSDKRVISTGDVIRNNYITRIGQDYYGTCGIAAGFTDNVQIEHNYVYNVPYTGISVGYGWTDEENAMKNNIIANNEIRRAMTILADGAGIYTLSKQPGTIIKENYIHDLKKSPWASDWPMAGIYLDRASGGTLERPFIVERNVVDVDFIDGKPFIFGKKYIVLLVNNFMRPIDADEYQKIIDGAGLEDEFRNLKIK